MAGVDHGVGGQGAEFVPDGTEDGREVRERASGGARAAGEQRVAGEHRAQCRGVEASRSGGVPRGRDGAQFDTAGGEHLAVGEGAECLVGVSRLPQHGVGGVQQNGRVQVGTQLRGDGDVIVVAVGAHHRDHMAPGDGVFDRLGIVCRVDDDHLGAVTDDPDVVVDFPTAAVEFKVAMGDDPLDSGLLGGH